MGRKRKRASGADAFYQRDKPLWCPSIYNKAYEDTTPVSLRFARLSRIMPRDLTISARGGVGPDCARHSTPSAIDRKADPCVDFYQYACGTWMKQTHSRLISRVGDASTRFRSGTVKSAPSNARQSGGREASRTPGTEDRRLLRRLHGRSGDQRQRNRPAQTGSRPHQRASMTKPPSPTRSLRCYRTWRIAVLPLRLVAGRQELHPHDRAISTKAASASRIATTTSKTDEKSVEIRKQYVAHIQKMFELRA